MFGRFRKSIQLRPEHERLNAIIGRWINEGRSAGDAMAA